MPSSDRWTHESWAQEKLRRAVGRIAAASEGVRHDETVGAAASVADYVAAGVLSREGAASTLLQAAIAAGLSGKREKEARRCIEYGLDKGDANKAWYPIGSDGPEPAPRRFKWRRNGQITEFKIADPPRETTPTRITKIPSVPLTDETFRITLFPGTKQPQGRAETWTWGELAARCLEPLAWPEKGKGDLPMWTWAELEGDSRAQIPEGIGTNGKERYRPARVDKIHALVLDYDEEIEFTTARVHEWWGDVQYVAHTSASHQAPKGNAGAIGRGRVIVAVSRPMTVAEYLTIAEWVLTCGRGSVGTKEIRDTHRAYYVPTKAPTGYWHHAHLSGVALDVDTLLYEIEEANTRNEQQAMANEPDPAVLPHLDLTEDGDARNTLRNVVEILDRDHRWKGRIRHCTFSLRDLLDGLSLTDAAEVEIAVWVAKIYRVNPSANIVHQAIQAVASRHQFHPIQSYLFGLKWDGKPRLLHLLRYMGAPSTEDGLSEIYGVKWMISAVARVLEPGCQADHALILAGAKGLGKTSAFRDLAGLDWYAESALPIGERDGYQQLQGVWIYELGELDSVRRSENSAVKQFLTTREDKFRPSYGRNVVQRKRQCVFCGTTNDVEFLQEIDRRWWVRRVTERADLAWIKANRDQLWAEAVHRYKAGETWWLDSIEHQERQQADVEQYRQSDAWEDIVRAAVPKGPVTVLEVLTGPLKMEPKDIRKLEQMRVGQILAGLGFVKRKRKHDVIWEHP